MKVIKRKDLLAQIKREEAERAAEKQFEAYLADDTTEKIAVDCFDALRYVVEVQLKHIPFDPKIHVDVYDQLEILRVRFKNQGIKVEWRDILPDYLEGTYGSMDNYS